MKKGNKNELFNFGKGWGTIIFCLLMFWFYAGMVNDSSNVVAPAVAEKLGIPAGNVLYGYRSCHGRRNLLLRHGCGKP